MKTNLIIVFWKALEMSYKNAKACRVSHLKSWRWPSRNLQVTLQGQTNGTILCPPWNRTTFVWNIFVLNLWISRYFSAYIKMAYPVYRNGERRKNSKNIIRERYSLKLFKVSNEIIDSKIIISFIYSSKKKLCILYAFKIDGYINFLKIYICILKTVIKYALFLYQ